MYYNNIYEFKNTKMTYNLEQEYYLQIKEKLHSHDPQN
jgi:hypothetical protein